MDKTQPPTTSTDAPSASSPPAPTTDKPCGCHDRPTEPVADMTETFDRGVEYGLQRAGAAQRHDEATRAMAVLFGAAGAMDAYRRYAIIGGSQGMACAVAAGALLGLAATANTGRGALLTGGLGVFLAGASIRHALRGGRGG